MPLPTNDEKILFGPLIPPFGRNPRKDIGKDLRKGEDILYDLDQGTYDAKDNNYPEDVIYISSEKFELLINDCPKYKDRFLEEKYLWIIGELGLRLIRELTKNTARKIKDKEYVCHTNLTGGREAYQGGELWFCENKRLGLNYFSDRYGATTPTQWDAVIKHFENVGYKNVIELFPMKETK